MVKTGFLISDVCFFFNALGFSFLLFLSLLSVSNGMLVGSFVINGSFLRVQDFSMFFLSVIGFALGH